MRILVATDGSTHADRAVTAVADLDWGTDAVVRLVTVLVEPVDPLGVLPAELVEAAIDDEMRGTLARGVSLLGPLATLAQRAVVRGRPPDAIIEEAEVFDADLIVVGHRGRGPVAARLIGSVAAEVAERATRPVLVVRGLVAGPIVLGDDGSPQAEAARRIIATWPAFRRCAVRVVSVARAQAPIASVVAASARREVGEAYRSDLARSLADRARIARAAELELRAAGLAASGSVAIGDAATTILDAAAAMFAGLIVVGCRGHGGIRALLGTTAKAVILRAQSSVLIVHAASGKPGPD